MKANVMTYEKTGSTKSKSKDVDYTLLKNMSTGRIIGGGLRELYRRYSTEIWAFACFSTWGLIIWYKLGI